MSAPNTCPRCGDSAIHTSPDCVRFACTSLFWLIGSPASSLAQSFKCLQRQRDALAAHVKKLEGYVARLEESGDHLAEVTLRNGASHDRWLKAREGKP